MYVESNKIISPQILETLLSLTWEKFEHLHFLIKKKNPEYKQCRY